jgi:hypothetical protein
MIHGMLQNPAVAATEWFKKCREPEYSTIKHALHFQRALGKQVKKNFPNSALFSV